MGSTLAALVIVGGFIWLINIRRKKRKETRKNRAGKIIQTRKKSNDKSQQEDVKAELNTDNDHAIYELSGSRNSRRQTQLDVSSSLPSWIGDQPRYLRDRPGVEELNVGSTVPGLSQSDPLLGPHEMHGSLTTRIELAGDGPSEFHGSNPISLHTSSGRTSPVFRSTNQSPVPRSVGPSPASFHTLSTIPSSLHRLWSRRPLSQASTQEFVPSPPSATPLPSTHTAAAASSSSSQGNELPNPIPPTIEGSPSSSQAKHLSFLRGITESGH